jgi:hypothetical protein
MRRTTRSNRSITTALVTLGWTLALAAAAQALAVPVQTSPADGATITGWRNITFTWNLVSGLPKYGIQIQAFDASSTWVDVKTVHNIDKQVSRYTFANFTTSDYGRWRVRSEDSASNSAWSGWRLFFIGPGITTVPQPAKVTEVAKTVSLAASSEAQVRAVCPTGTIVVGGGWSSGATNQVFTEASTHNLDAWMVTFKNLTSSAHNVTAYAECLQGASGYSFDVMTSSNPAPGFVGAAQPTCTKGVLSGGGFLTTSEANLPFTLMPFSSTGWDVFSLNVGSATASLFGEAVCLVGTGATVNLALGAPHTLAASSTVSAAVACVSSKVALGGGWTATHDGAAARSFRRSSNGNGWRVGAEDLGFNSGNSVSADAICAKFP